MDDRQFTLIKKVTLAMGGMAREGGEKVIKIVTGDRQKGEGRTLEGRTRNVTGYGGGG